MARPQAADYDDRRAMILDCAAEVFAREGFHKAGMRDIAAACGLSKAALYHYFPSKQDILHAIMADHTAVLNETAERVAAVKAGADEKIRMLARAFMAHYVESAARHVVMLNELGALEDRQRAEVIAGERKIVRTVLELLEEINPSLGERPELQLPAAMAFMAMVNWTHTWFRADGPLSAEGFADLVADITLKGLPGIEAGGKKPVRLAVS